MGLELDNIETLKKVITCIQSLPDVYSVKRIQTSSNMLKKTSSNKPKKSFRQKKKQKKVKVNNLRSKIYDISIITGKVY